MISLKNFVSGAWTTGSGDAVELVNPATAAVIASAPSAGIDLRAMTDFARARGGASLRSMDFQTRGALLKRLAKTIHAHRDELLSLAIDNGGNTRSDAKFDIDGASGTLAHYAELGIALGARRLLLDGEPTQLGRSPRYVGQHVFAPRRGVAVLINAFNFPAWGMAEKMACAVLAGMPVIVRPATATALVTHRIAELWTAEAELPEGVFTLLTASHRGLLDNLDWQDVVSFTGSSHTSGLLRSHAAISERGARLNVEADSLNGAILGEDVAAGDDTFGAFVRDVSRDMLQKAGQKCTAIRRIFVHESRAQDVIEALCERIAEARVGNPADDGVTVGPVATRAQLASVREGLAALLSEAKQLTPSTPVPSTGFFVAPTLLQANPGARRVHELEVFGPVSSIVVYKTSADLPALLELGKGSLVTSVYSSDRAVGQVIVENIAHTTGRIVWESEKVLEQIPGPGTVLPQSIHGGPGRAGGGEELGGLRGLAFYSQRVAVQGDRPWIESVGSEAEARA